MIISYNRIFMFFEIDKVGMTSIKNILSYFEQI